MRPWPVPPFLMALSTRWRSTPPSSSRSGPVTPCAWTASRLWQLLQVCSKSSLPSFSRSVSCAVRREPTPPRLSSRPAITPAGTPMPSTRNGTRTSRTSIGAALYRARWRARASGSVRRCAAGALPAAVRGEHVAELGHAVVSGGALLVVDHQEPLGTRADGLRHVADCLADLRLRRGALRSGALRVVREDSGRAAASAGLGRRGRPRAARPDQQPAVRTAQRLLRPVL